MPLFNNNNRIPAVLKQIFSIAAKFKLTLLVAHCSRIETIGEGAGLLGLYIQKLQEKDTGVYNCTAVYAGNQNLHVSIDIKSYGERLLNNM